MSGKFYTLLIVVLMFLSADMLQAQRIITKEELQEDFRVLQSAYKTLHPSLYRYEAPKQVNQYFAALKAELNRDMELPEAYLVFSQFIQKLKCSHTLVNPFNQGDEVQAMILEAADKLPFLLQLVGNRFLLTNNASGNELLDGKIEIIKINGIPVKQIIDSLLTVTVTDGNNYHKQYAELNLTGIGKFETFDTYFSLFFPPTNGVFEIEAVNLKTQDPIITTVKAISRLQRSQILAERSGQEAPSYDDLWQFKVIDGDIAYLKLGTFVTYKMKMDWKKFLDNAFAKINQQNIEYLVIDIRDNSGGMDEVYKYLLQFLVKRNLVVPNYIQKSKYKVVPDSIREYVSTWDDSFYDISNEVGDMKDGFYTFKNQKDTLFIPKRKRAFQGELLLLTNGANSSATFTLARILKQSGLARVIGQPTGGNMKGTTGGRMLFLTLPNSEIEMDLPLIGYYPQSPQRNMGIIPNDAIRPNINNIVDGKDDVINYVKEVVESFRD